MSTSTTADSIAEDQRPKRPRIGLSGQVIIGLVLGISAGLFFGESAAVVQPLGSIFIALLQMTVIPYIVVSLIAAIGRLSMDRIKLLAVKGGGLILIFWGLILVVVALIPLGYPDWESASFYSTSLLEEPTPTDFLALYIPANPFAALSDGTIPAIVLFCIAMGLATSLLRGKAMLVDFLDELSHALMLIAQFVAKLAPIGVFALTATAAGTMGVEEFGRVQVYIVTYIAMALLLSLWVVPGLVSALTPIGFKDTLVTTRDALVTAFATGSLLIVLPLLAESTKEILERAGVSREESSSVVDVVTPINFNIPNLGKLIALSFVLFAGWFAGNPVPLSQYPEFLASGLFSFFGEVVIALPFLLDLMNVPADMFNLFVAVDVFTGRFGTLLAGVHTVALSILITAAVAGVLKVRWRRLGVFITGSAALGIGTLLLINLIFSTLVENRYTKDDAILSMTFKEAPWPRTRVDSDASEPAPRPEDPASPGQSALDRITERDALRACYVGGLLPQSYVNSAGSLVGYDIELMHALAADLDVRLDLIPIERERFADLLDDGYCDLIATGLTITPERARRATFSVPYLTDGLGVVISDAQRKAFSSMAALRERDDLRIAVLSGLSLYEHHIKRGAPMAEIVRLDSLDDFFTKDGNEPADALVTLAMIGSAYTLLHPSYSLVVPKPAIRVPIALALRKGDTLMKDYVDNWLLLKQQSGELDALYDYWVQGQAVKNGKPRWSIARDVLGWMD
ncbi:cation:dicarboxylate symporter family transporter [Thiorhodococcus minor]|uniref:Cation:dicarboxylase symporter family transporter n=1 Tax=Thiorhodococcus minor TaxID=57489 RepID=A0A6M0K5J3_9GAMM|nr:cation:dicarboxylase symporter family transporter [Thiorhodococcus minor]NEV65022.1 cation:dicarboxylase symporter family transporter [Thiorhodococcus minor]